MDNILYTPLEDWRGEFASNSMFFNISNFVCLFKQPELKTLEWDILNPDRLIWVSNVHTFDFILNPLFGYPYMYKSYVW